MIISCDAAANRSQSQVFGSITLKGNLKLVRYDFSRVSTHPGTPGYVFSDHASGAKQKGCCCVFDMIAFGEPPREAPAQPSTPYVHACYGPRPKNKKDVSAFCCNRSMEMETFERLQPSEGLVLSFAHGGFHEELSVKRAKTSRTTCFDKSTELGGRLGVKKRLRGSSTMNRTSGCVGSRLIKRNELAKVLLPPLKMKCGRKKHRPPPPRLTILIVWRLSGVQRSKKSRPTVSSLFSDRDTRDTIARTLNQLQSTEVTKLCRELVVVGAAVVVLYTPGRIGTSYAFKMT